MIIEPFLNHLSINRKLSSETIKAYRADLGLFAAFLSERGLRINQVTPSTMADYILYRKAKGKIPRAPSIVAQDYSRPAAMKAGAIPEGYRGRFGWHNLRRSLATFFAASEISLPAIQSIVRHSRPSTTALYTHRVNAPRLAAQQKFLQAINITPTAD